VESSVKETATSVRNKYAGSIGWGVAAALLLLLFYGVVNTVASRSFVHTVSEFRRLWPWLLPLIIGFGTQIGMFVYIRRGLHVAGKAAPGAAVAAGAGTGTSTVAMLACCAHHLTEVLPIIGLSGAAIFLVKYQSLFLTIGIAANALGIGIMLRIILKYRRR
jgi:hypothetical protein